MRRLRDIITIVSFCVALGAVGVQANVIKRIDIFDGAHNHLLFVTFEYDSAGKNIGRTVYASDSTFLRSTVYVVDGTGKTIREVSLDYNGDTLFTTNLSSQGTTSTFSVFDRFGLDQLGSPMTLTESSSGNYAVTQSGTSLQYKEEYVFSRDSALSRINLYDQSNELIYYAAVTNITPIVSNHFLKIRASASVMTEKNGRFRVRLSLTKSAFVTMTVYDLAGRTVSVPVKKRFPAADMHIAIAASSKNGKPLCSGAYIVRIMVDEMVCYTDVRIIQR